MKEIKVEGEWYVVDSLKAAIDEFGDRCEPSTLRDYVPQITEYFAMFNEVYATNDDSEEMLVMKCISSEDAERTAATLNEKLASRQGEQS